MASNERIHSKFCEYLRDLSNECSWHMAKSEKKVLQEGKMKVFYF